MPPEWNHLKSKRWDIARVNAYFAKLPWQVGCNYIPSCAINQLEMFQAGTFNLPRIAEELWWAEDLGFNSLRVFLHYLLWEADPQGTKERMRQFLEACEARQIKVLWVFFDDCWNQEPTIGPQPAPQPGIHNSGWAASPGRHRVLDPSCHPQLAAYVKDIVQTFKGDVRVLGWDLYNEAGNTSMGLQSFPLLLKAFEAAREVDPAQPITSGIWHWRKWKLGLARTWRTYFHLLVNVTDFITFHNYSPAGHLRREIKDLRRYHRPVLCTEYMARKSGSFFATHLPVLREYHVGAMNWGFVDGKTQTKFPWGAPPNGPEPEPWFHEILHPDGTAYRAEEVAFLRKFLRQTRLD